MIKRALISVYDKEHILDLAKYLAENGTEILSTGGTLKHLKENNISAIDVSEVTNFPEMLDGRVKTLHPMIHGGILAIRNNAEHMDTIKNHNIVPIEMVVVNLYPFFEKVKEDLTFEEKVEFIDIGGPTMLRAAAKNYQDVVVLCNTKDYKGIIEELKSNGDIDIKTRKRLAGKVFNLMSAYDAAISNFMLQEEYPEYISLSFKKDMNMRYGENPHQSASYYVDTVKNGAMKDFDVLNGKALSYNNLKDLDIAWKVVCEFEEIAACGLKHNSPCGVAIGSDVHEAYTKAYSCDPTSIFGGIVAVNKKLDVKTANEMVKIFLEVVAAPDFDDAALEVLKTKKNLRVVKCNYEPQNTHSLVSIDGGILVQSEDNKLAENMEVVTKVAPTSEEMKNLIFGMKVVKYVKSNAIVAVRDFMTVGVGGGQVNRIWPTEDALRRGKNATILASDAFFPFDDVVKEAKKYNIKAIIQPGGAQRDQDSINFCNENGIAMVFTHIRHFKH